MKVRIPLLLAALLWSTAALAQGTLRIGIAEDPDSLDPALNRTAAGRQPMTAFCDKLFDVSPKLEIVPMLATGYEIAPDGRSVTLKLRPNVTFHDGEPLDAEAVRFNLERSQTLPGTLRRTELSALESVTVIDSLTVKLSLKRPQGYLMLFVLAERSGMMVSPKAAKALGERFTTRPVCAGPYSFVERVPQGRIVGQKFAAHWNAAAYSFDRVEYLPITDSTVRLAALRSGEIQIAERLTPTDLAQLKGDARVQVASAPDLGFHMLRLNTNNGARAATFGRDPRIRAAVEAAIDRRVIVQALFDDQYLAGNQFVNPTSPFYDPTHPIPPRDVAKARRLLREAKAENLSFTLLVPAERERQEVAQMLQAMLAEAGITMKLETQDNPTMLQSSQQGRFEAAFGFWSGRPHPDGNSMVHFSCGGSLNDAKSCNEALDKVLVAGQEATDATERQKLYRAANGLLVEDRSAIILFHRRTFTGLSAKLQGFVAHPDSTIRLDGLKLT